MDITRLFHLQVAGFHTVAQLFWIQRGLRFYDIAKHLRDIFISYEWGEVKWYTRRLNKTLLSTCTYALFHLSFVQAAESHHEGPPGPCR